MFVLINPLFHPYAGMIRIRLEGIISACTRRHPLKSAAKVVQIEQNTKYSAKKKRINFHNFA